MKAPLKSMVLVIGVIVGMVAVPGSFAETQPEPSSSSVSAEKGPELPDRLWDSIRGGDRAAIVWCDWEAVGDLPFIQRALEAEDEEPLKKIPMLGSVLRSVKVVEPVVGHIADVWCEMGAVDGGNGDSTWMKTPFEPEQIRVRLEAEDWYQSEDESTVYIQPFDRVKDHWIFELMEERKGKPDFDADEWMRDWATSSKWHIHIGDEGWINVSREARSLRSAMYLWAPDLEKFDPEDFGFPFADLVTGERTELCMMAVDVPGNEEKENVSHSELLDAEIRVLEAQLRELKDADELSILVSTGDVLLTVTETDGGIALDLEAALPTGEMGELSTQVLETTLAILRLAVLWVGPELSRDLGSTVFHDAGDSVVASAVISRASLYDAIDRLVEHDDQVRELKARIKELRELRAAEEAAAEDGS